MKKTERENMLLFSKERIAGLHRYRLYFTPIVSLKEDTPRVFRLLVRTPVAFNRFEIGRVYTLVYNNIYIIKSEPREEFNLLEEDFSRLLQTRDLKFMDKKTSAALRAREKPNFSKDRYYTFEETKQIVNYRPDFLSTVAISTFSGVMTGIAFLVPFLLYAYMIYLIGKSQLNLTGFSAKALALPVMGIGALPVTIFLMSILFTFSGNYTISVLYKK